MKTLFRFFGSKHLMAPIYGAPRREIVVEPFAGSCGYSTYWEPKVAILVEKDERIYNIWKWLINATTDDIMDLDHTITDLSQCPHYPQHIQDFIGYWLGWGVVEPFQKISKALVNEAGNRRNQTIMWSNNIKIRVAQDVNKIKHWTIIHGDYSDAPDIEAHWSIDPPYIKEGDIYRHGKSDIDFKHLAAWCRSRKGAVDVFESDPADWLPFEIIKTTRNRQRNPYKELLWRKDDTMNMELFE